MVRVCWKVMLPGNPLQGIFPRQDSIPEALCGHQSTEAWLVPLAPPLAQITWSISFHYFTCPPLKLECELVKDRNKYSLLDFYYLARYLKPSSWKSIVTNWWVFHEVLKELVIHIRFLQGKWGHHGRTRTCIEPYWMNHIWGCCPAKDTEESHRWER